MLAVYELGRRCVPAAVVNWGLGVPWHGGVYRTRCRHGLRPLPSCARPYWVVAIWRR